MKVTRKMIVEAIGNADVAAHGCDYFNASCNECWAAVVDALPKGVKDKNLLEKIQEVLTPVPSLTAKVRRRIEDKLRKSEGEFILSLAVELGVNIED